MTAANAARHAQAAAEQQCAARNAEAISMRASMTAAEKAKDELQAQIVSIGQHLAVVQRSAKGYQRRAEAAEKGLAESGRALCDLERELQTVHHTPKVAPPAGSCDGIALQRVCDQ